MKINDVVYTTLDEYNKMPRFDVNEPPRKAKWYLQVLAWVLSFPETFATKADIRKHNMDDLKGPYILLCNHNSFLDFKVATRAVFPRRSSYVVAVDGFINREEIMRNVGCFGTRKFISDIPLVRSIKHSLEQNGTICQLYPEARYSLVGTTAILPDSLGKLVKRLGYPVATLISHGHHLRQPVWNLTKRKVRTSSDITQILTQEDLVTMSVDEINAVIRNAFQYDDYQYQVDHKIRIAYPKRAEGLHKILYKCPACKTEFKMRSEDNKLWCSACGETHEMDDLGRLHNTGKETKFIHIPDWYEWIRLQVKQEILLKKYKVELEVQVDVLPNSTGFYRLGQGSITHDLNGFHLTGKWDHGILDVKKPVKSNYGLHLEFDYFGKGDGFSFTNNDDTYYLYPINQEFSVTKLHFAVEELYKLESEKKGS